MSQVRRANRNGELSEGRIVGLLSGDTDKIRNVKTTEEYRAPQQVPGYRFSGQVVTVGEFDYVDEHPFAESDRLVSVDFMYRDKSRLFIFQVQQDDLSGEVLREINTSLPSDIRIQPGFGGSRRDIWDFILAAEQYGEIHVLHEGEIVDKDDLELSETELRDKVIWDAEVYFRNPETQERNLVIYHQESLHIQADDLRDVEYLIQVFEDTMIK
jgi:hypothetical protein